MSSMYKFCILCRNSLVLSLSVDPFLFSFFPPGFQQVTCGSVLKLVHSQSNHCLHSHDVKYGSGSGQQVKFGPLKLVNTDHVHFDKNL